LALEIQFIQLYSPSNGCQEKQVPEAEVLDAS
jgi:hypothetical protein